MDTYSAYHLGMDGEDVRLLFDIVENEYLKLNDELQEIRKTGAPAPMKLLQRRITVVSLLENLEYFLSQVESDEEKLMGLFP